MKSDTLEQILKVILVTAQRYKLGDGIELSYQYAVNQVSKEYSVTYQTIGDACRRRLHLKDIGEFKKMLNLCLHGDSSKMRELLIRNTSHFNQHIISDFFSKLTIGEVKNEIEPKLQETFVNYTIQLRKSDSDILKALSQLLGGEPEKIFVEIAIEAVKDRMKKTVNQL